jgi:hypothetical protein
MGSLEPLTTNHEYLTRARLGFDLIKFTTLFGLVACYCKASSGSCCLKNGVEGTGVISCLLFGMVGRSSLVCWLGVQNVYKPCTYACFILLQLTLNTWWVAVSMLPIFGLKLTSHPQCFN